MHTMKALKNTILKTAIFELEQKADAVLLKKVESENDVVLYENFYKEVPKAISNATLRIFGERNDINLVCVMEGRAPQKDGEIALDRCLPKTGN